VASVATGVWLPGGLGCGGTSCGNEGERAIRLAAR
jgi:hypothetical protein